ncbi:MAG: ribosome rescue GTPase HflX [Gammaproteobacteria bacterium]
MQNQESVILVHVDFSDAAFKAVGQEDLFECQELVRSAGAIVDTVITAKRAMPDSKYFVGKGKAEEIASAVKIFKANLIIFNHNLTPAQERNLEKLCECRVVDRTGLILDIFAQRARSFEGKLQVELAQLQHMATRLVRGWTHLERQRGGIGMRGGPGETQLEVDRRLIRDRIALIKERLGKVRSEREHGRRARKRAALPTVALVGYTNTGKSTLFNRLTKAEAYVANKLFATLDPTLRRVEMAGVGEVILVDTVGFVRHLPHSLVDAFRATLEETLGADLLLHVVDASDLEYQEKIRAVDVVLKEIGADEVPILYVYNKIDLLPDASPRVDCHDNKIPSRVWMSAQNGMGIELLTNSIRDFLSQKRRKCNVILDVAEGKLRALLHEKNAILSEKIDKKGQWHISISMPRSDFLRLRKICSE